MAFHMGAAPPSVPPSSPAHTSIKEQTKPKKPQKPKKPKPQALLVDGVLVEPPPQSGFMVFSAEMRPKIKQEEELSDNAVKANQEIVSILGKRWKALTEEQQIAYNDVVRKKRALYKQAVEHHAQQQPPQ